MLKAHLKTLTPYEGASLKQQEELLEMNPMMWLCDVT